MKSSSQTSRRRRKRQHEDFYEAMPLAGTWTAPYYDAADDEGLDRPVAENPDNSAKRTAIITLVVVGLLTAGFAFLLLQGLELVRDTTLGVETLQY